MDLLHTYPNFESDISEAFHDLIQEFHLELINPSEGLYLLKGGKCKLRFAYDRGDIFCDIKQYDESDHELGYGVYQIYRHLFPSQIEAKYTERIYDFKLQLQYYAEIVDKYLRLVLNGDFSWLPSSWIEQNYENKLLPYVLINFRDDHIIKRKLLSGDPTWRNDIKVYLRKRNIKL